jgi:hypothetical protein
MSKEQYIKSDYVLKYAIYYAQIVICIAIRAQGSIARTAPAIVAANAGGDRHQTYKK